MSRFGFEKTQPTIKTVWTVVDSHWVNIHRSSILNGNEEVLPNLPSVLASYLYFLQIDYIPDYINYFTAETNTHYIKYRVYGATITIYATPL